MTASEPPPTRIELYVRSLAPGAARATQETVIRHLRQLENDGVIDEWTTTVWGEQICPNGVEATTETGRRILDRLTAFHEWAGREGRSLQPGFSEREVSSSFTDEDYDVIKLPSMAMAEYHDDELQFVTPSCRADSVLCVWDRLEQLGAETDQPRKLVVGER